MIACLLSRPVWAEDDKTSESIVQLGNITVTATKISTQVDNVPTNINVITHEELKKFPGHYNVITVLQEANIPGLFFSTNVFGGGSASTQMSTMISGNTTLMRLHNGKICTRMVRFRMATTFIPGWAMPLTTRLC